MNQWARGYYAQWESMNQAQRLQFVSQLERWVADKSEDSHTAALALALINGGGLHNRERKLRNGAQPQALTRTSQ